jgi:hypothetical protein
MPMSANQCALSTATPLDLLYNYEVVDSAVVGPELEPEQGRFDVAPRGRPQDAMLRFTAAGGLIQIELHEPEQLVLDTRLDVERRLPPIVIAVRRRGVVEPIRLLGRDWGERLRGPVWVRRFGPPREPSVTIGTQTRASFALDRGFCELTWNFDSRPRSLRLTVAWTNTQLILRPRSS